MVWQGQYDKLFMAGEWVAPLAAEQIDVISPMTEQVIARVPSSGRADVDRAVALSRAAFDTGPWPRMPVEDRIAALLRLRDQFSLRRNELAQLLTDEMGTPIGFSRTMQTGVPIWMIEAQTEIATRYPWRVLRRSATGNGLVLREPKGVVAAIVPWNAPMMVTMAKLGPALLSGCTAILKPAPESSLSAYMLGEMVAAAGFPPGVLSILPAGRDAAEYLALHPGVDKVSFTGSSAAGRHLAEKCGALLRPITLELGGKSAAVFLDDADIRAGVDSLRMGSLRNSGQICSLKTRILVSKRREEEVLAAFADLIDSMPVGDPSDPLTQIGPMVSQRQRDRVEGYIAKGLAEGARAVRGGVGRPEGLNHGWFVRPTLLAGVDPNATVAQEEIFGPVLAFTTYDTEDEAIALANTSDFGLNGAIFSQDVDKAIRLAGRIKTGTVEINGGGVGFHSPIGGVKSSGLGREGGPEGFDPYVEIKSIGLPKAFADAIDP